MMRDGGTGMERGWQAVEGGPTGTGLRFFLASRVHSSPSQLLCHPRHPQALMNAYVLEFRPSSNMPFSFCNKPGLSVSGDLA